jgi:hypothetical protein
MKRKKRRRGKSDERPFLTGDPSVDYRVKWAKYPLKRTEEEVRQRCEFYDKLKEDYHSVYPRSSPRYEDEVRYEKKYHKYSDQDPADFARFVNEWRKEQGIPERSRDKPSDEFLEAMRRVYLGKVYPVIMR